MAKHKSRTQPRRQPLSRARVLRAALTLVDKAGVESLSMRGLAGTLGVERALSARRVFLRHPWAAGLIESRIHGSPVGLHYANAVLGLLRQGGFTVPMAHRAFLLIDSYLYGFVPRRPGAHPGRTGTTAGHVSLERWRVLLSLCRE